MGSAKSSVKAAIEVVKANILWKKKHLATVSDWFKEAVKDSEK
jgi:molybdopterin synthase catalytic subunit